MPLLQEHLKQLGQSQDGSAPDQRHGKQDISDLAPTQHEQTRHLTRKLSEESIRTELCEGPIPDSPRAETPERLPEQDITTVSDRAILIERLKRGESPTWVPSRHLESLFQQHPTLRTPIESPRQPSSNSPTLLPPPSITPDKADPRQDQNGAHDRLRDGLNIERPRSALHSGDFTHVEPPKTDEAPGQPSLRTHDTGIPYQPSNVGHSWLATSPPRDAFTQLDFGRRKIVPSRMEGPASGLSSLSSSLSLSQSWAYKPPTSPLVQSEVNDDLVDLSHPMNSIDITRTTPRDNTSRRHTVNFSPSSPYPYAAHAAQRREGTYPYQAHQPRRSLTSTPNFSMFVPSRSPQTLGYQGSRRPSFSSDATPLLHASMVGSYEESILRGRMSTTPSKPLDFLAQIGVLGLGKCKASLKCPSHVTLPFSAVFYSYASTAHGRSSTEDGPSPYVGQIDLENGLSNSENENRARRKIQSRYSERRPTEEDEDMDLDVENAILDRPEEAHKPVSNQKRGSRKPKAPPGGSYRIPEKGQLQIIIKNQNKTAVKLFLVPYDLAGMEPGTKTFIRQRSYSAGPIIGNVPDAKDVAIGTQDRPILRYLVHLHICCPAKGRYYLYKEIRVVFANRVPDGKEKLRNEVTYPEPRFSPYKPIRVMHPPAPSGPAAMLAADKAFRRRSMGYSFAGHQSRPQIDGLLGLPTLISPVPVHAPPPLPFNFPNPGNGNNDPVDTIPLVLSRTGQVMSDATRNTSEETKDSQSLRYYECESVSTTTTTTSQDSGSLGSQGQQTRYDKLNRGDVGYGGNLFTVDSQDGSTAAEGLLSKRLRSLGMRHDDDTAHI